MSFQFLVRSLATGLPDLCPSVSLPAPCLLRTSRTAEQATSELKSAGLCPSTLHSPQSFGRLSLSRSRDACSVAGVVQIGFVFDVCRFRLKKAGLSGFAVFSGSVGIRVCSGSFTSLRIPKTYVGGFRCIISCGANVHGAPETCLWNEGSCCYIAI